MSFVAYIGLGWLALVLWTAVGARLGLGHVLPDAAIVVVVFVALKREPIPVMLTALALGYLSGRQALAPLGLHESAMVASAITVYLTAGNLAGSGAGFFALASGGTVALYHVLLFLGARLTLRHVGFSGWATASLIPSALVTAALAWVSHPVLVAIERRLRPARREELLWQ